MGLLSAQDWKGKWITRDMPVEQGDYASGVKWIWAADDNALTKPTPGKHEFRFGFTLDQKPKSATLLITAKDNVVAWINGKQVIEESPMTNFGRRREPWGSFQVVTVGKWVVKGANSIAAEAIVDKPDDNGISRAGLIALLRIEMPDGKTQRFVSGPEWKTTSAQSDKAWTATSFNDSSWANAAAVAEIGKSPLGTPWPAEPIDAFRKKFDVAKTVRSARIYSTALGTYELFLNGKRVSDDILAPGLDGLPQAHRLPGL